MQMLPVTDAGMENWLYTTDIAAPTPFHAARLSCVAVKVRSVCQYPRLASFWVTVTSNAEYSYERINRLGVIGVEVGHNSKGGRQDCGYERDNNLVIEAKNDFMLHVMGGPDCQEGKVDENKPHM
jgi:hypothetical protein